MSADKSPLGFILAAGIALLTACLSMGAPACGVDEDPCAEPYSCPEAGWINCGLPMDPEMVDLCEGTCHDWITQHCPDVEFAY